LGETDELTFFAAPRLVTVVVFFVAVTLGFPARVFFGDAFLVEAVAFVTAGFVTVVFDLAEAGLVAGFLVMAAGFLAAAAAGFFVVAAGFLVADVGLATGFEIVLDTGLEF